MTEMNRDHLEGVLHGFYYANFTVNDAYSKMLKIVEKEVFSRDEIEKFYEIWDSENVKNDLSYMPEPVTKTITKFLDLQSRINFRESSSKIRDVVDISHLHIDEFNVALFEKSMVISTDKGVLRTYSSFNGKCIIEQGTKTRAVKYGTIWTESDKYLTKILSWKNLTIGKLRVECPTGRLPENVGLISETIFRFPLKVEELIGENTAKIVANGITKLDSNHLKHFTIGDHFTTLTREVLNSDQWKNLDSFTARFAKFDIDAFPKSFSHLKTCTFRSRIYIPFEKVMELKEDLLKNPSFCSMLIFTSQFSKEDMKKFAELTNVSVPIEMNQSMKFDYPGNTGKKLTMIVNDRKVHFICSDYEGKRDPTRNNRIVLASSSDDSSEATSDESSSDWTSSSESSESDNDESEESEVDEVNSNRSDNEDTD